MTRQKKWLPVEDRAVGLVRSPDELFAEASKHEGRRYVWLFRRAVDPRVVCCNQFATVCAWIRDQQLVWCYVNPKWAPKQAGLYAASVYGSPAEGMPF